MVSLSRKLTRARERAKIKRLPSTIRSAAEQYGYNSSPVVRARLDALRQRMLEHAVYDPSPNPESEGRRGWMTHPAGEPNRPDKGLRDGSCNRTACQDVLAGQPRWSMVDYAVKDGRLYYCATCARDFNMDNRRHREPERCAIREGDET